MKLHHKLLSQTSFAAQKPNKKVNCAIYGCGLSASGALAIPKLVNANLNDDDVVATPKEIKHPKRIPFFNTENIKHISSGFGFSLFGSSSKLYGAGLNNRFQIAGRVLEKNRGQEYYISPKKVNIPSGCQILGVSSGRAHSLILTNEGVYAIGDNCFGQCGINPELHPVSVGTSGNQLEKLEIETDHPIVQVHCSLDTSFLLNSIGEVFAFGLNEDGQCANEQYGIQWKPTKIRGDAAETPIDKISGSTDTLLAVSKNGQLFIWGQTEYSQAAEATEEIQLNVSRQICRSLKVVSAGSTSTSCLVSTDESEVFSWGVGVLGFGPSVQKLACPTKLDQPLFDNRKVKEVFAGNSVAGAINEKGRLFVWGENRFSSLGIGHGKRQLFPYQLFIAGDIRNVSFGPDHTLILAR